MGETTWYVVQVQTGRESALCQKIERVCASVADATDSDRIVLRECFAPCFACKRKRRGEWVDETSLLLPGYVIAVTDDPWGLMEVLRDIREFARVLRMGETYTPLNEDERVWIERWTRKGDRTIPMSFAYKEGEHVVVLDGPLVGQEAMIERINRRQRIAHLVIHAGSLTIRTTVGLEVLPSKPEA